MSYVCYDKAKWHYDGDFPQDLPMYQGFVHTGMFIGWLAEHDLLSGELVEEGRSVRRRKQTGAQLYEAWDGVLGSDMLTDEGNAFASYYFNPESERGWLYISDYIELLAGGDESAVYRVQDTWDNYEKLAERINSRFLEWKGQQQE